jgi:hypothetical protein
VPSEYEIEMSDPSASTCECCGGLSVRLTRFVYRNGDAFGIYYAAYSNNHPDNELAVLLSLGEWGEGSDPSQRTAFYCRVRPTDDSYEVMLGDAAQSAWSDAAVVGAKLSREDALRHPWKDAAFEVLDEAFERDRSLRGFLHRAHCGDTAVPLERVYLAPEDIDALDDKTKGRAEVRRHFATLDGKRFFVRCLLSVPVEGYGTWSVGLWVEVARSDYDRVKKAWRDPDEYPTLKFTGTLANDVGKDLGLPVAPGSKVQLCVPNAGSIPTIAAAGSGELTALLSQTWPRAAFEEYAVAHGFL